MKKRISFLFFFLLVALCNITYTHDHECVGSALTSHRSALLILKYFQHCDLHRLLAEAIDIAQMHDATIPQGVWTCLNALQAGKRELDCVDLLETLAFILEHALALRCPGHRHVQQLCCELME